MGALRHPRQHARARASSRTRTRRRTSAACRSAAEREDARSPAGRVGRPRELGWAATFLASPYAAYVTGATLAVDGANWQRRAMLMPEFRPIREQLGKPPFGSE